MCIWIEQFMDISYDRRLYLSLIFWEVGLVEIGSLLCSIGNGCRICNMFNLSTILIIATPPNLALAQWIWLIQALERILGLTVPNENMIKTLMQVFGLNQEKPVPWFKQQSPGTESRRTNHWPAPTPTPRCLCFIFYLSLVWSGTCLICTPVSPIEQFNLAKIS